LKNDYLNPCASYRIRMEQTGCSPGALRRFQETTELYFNALCVQARDRGADHVPTLEEYIITRRDGSACKQCWALVEFAMGLNLPDEVMQHPIIVELGEAANDLVTWSNVSAFSRPARPSAWTRRS
jgi:hypothetical protein